MKKKRILAPPQSCLSYSQGQLSRFSITFIAQESLANFQTLYKWILRWIQILCLAVFVQCSVVYISLFSVFIFQISVHFNYFQRECIACIECILHMWLGCLPFVKCIQTVCVDQQFAFTKDTGEFHKVRGENEDPWAGRGLLFHTPHPGAGGWSPRTCLMGLFSPWLSLLWEWRVWQMALVFHDNAASVVWVPCQACAGIHSSWWLGAAGVALRSVWLQNLE